METRTIKDQIECSGAFIFARKTERFLLLQKTAGKHQGTWGLVGGTTNQGENAWQSLQREIQEEIGFFPEIIKTFPIEKFVSNDGGFKFQTFLCVVDNEFVPTLSNEHCGWAWGTADNAPKPLHQALKVSFTNKIIKTKLQTIFEIVNLI